MSTVAEQIQVRPLEGPEIVLFKNDICALAREFYSEGSLRGAFHEAIFIRDWSHYVTIGAGTFIAAFEEGRIIGFIGGLIHPDSPTGDLHASESFWFVGKGHRGIGLMLFAAFEQWAVAAGAARIAMVHLENEQSNTRLSELYIKHGYRKTETIYVKEVE